MKRAGPNFDVLAAKKDESLTLSGERCFVSIFFSLTSRILLKQLFFSPSWPLSEHPLVSWAIDSKPICGLKEYLKINLLYVFITFFLQEVIQNIVHVSSTSTDYHIYAIHFTDLSNMVMQELNAINCLSVV